MMNQSINSYTINKDLSDIVFLGSIVQRLLAYPVNMATITICI